MKCGGSAVQRYLAVHEVGCCSLLAGTSFVVFMTLLPLLIDPSVLTFVLDLEPAACLTVHSAVLNGTSNCTWTSCQQGCTVDIYKCWHVNVSYLLADPALAAQRLDRQLLLTDDDSPYPSQPLQPARLYPNVVGCGYPPDVDCDQFFRQYAQPHSGAFERTFPCYVSMTDPTVAVIHVDRFEAAVHLAIGFAPLLLCVVLGVYVSLRLRCQRRSQLTAQQSGAIAAARLAEEEQARRIIESKRRLESRKQSWLNAFRQERIATAASTSSPTATTLGIPSGSDHVAADVSVRKKQLFIPTTPPPLHYDLEQSHQEEPEEKKKQQLQRRKPSDTAQQQTSSSSPIRRSQLKMYGDGGSCPDSPVIASISATIHSPPAGVHRHVGGPHYYSLLPSETADT